MNVFLAGATGAIGQRLVPLLVGRGHRVFGSTRTAAKVAALRVAGVEPVVMDALDGAAVLRALESAKPEVVVHQMTALATMRSLKHFDDEFAETNRLRTEGLSHLLTAASRAGARRFVVQSYAGWPYAREGGRVKVEEDPLDATPPATMTKTLQAIRTLEASVTGASGLEGVVLRYGSFYGPGTSLAPGAEMAEAVRKRRLPVIGDGAGVWSFLHIDDAASATASAIEGGPPIIYNIVDDEPAEVSTWLPELARILGASRPYHLPAWIGRLIAGEAVVTMMTEMRGASNAKAKRLMNWRPAYTGWREGFRLVFQGPGAPLLPSQAERAVEA